MKLVDFMLDWPEADRMNRKAFRWQTRCVAALYERLFCEERTGAGWKVWKILVECVGARSRNDIEVLGVLRVQVRADPNECLGLDNERKKWWLSACLMRESQVLSIARDGRGMHSTQQCVTW